MELDEDFPDINAAPHIRFERFDRDDDLIIEFDNMFSNNGKQDPHPHTQSRFEPLKEFICKLFSKTGSHKKQTMQKINFLTLLGVVPELSL